MYAVQLLPTISYGDAVGNDTLAIREIIRQMGYETQIYAENIDGRLPARTAMPFSQFPTLSHDDVVIYHGSTGTDLNFRLPQLGGRKIMIYHNITPPDFFQPYSPGAEQLTAFGLQGIENLRDKLDYCIADSEFNKANLREMGYDCPIDVCPILIPFEDYEKTPNRQILQQYAGDDYVNILFTGRVAPNKKQEDIIRAFFYYHTYYNKKSRLILVGSWDGMEKYHGRLCDYVNQLGLSKSVIFTGHIKFDEILAYYRLADVFLCMSEHEGFCVPLVEAMYFDIPVIAYRSTAIPDTLGGSGLLLESKHPKVAAAVIHQVISDNRLRQKLVEEQRHRLKAFQYGVIKETLIELLQKFIDSPRRRTRRIIQLSSTISRGDAVSNDILAFHKVFLGMGYSNGIYTEIKPNGSCWENVRSVKELPSLSEDDIAIYHHATGTTLSKVFAGLPCKKVLVYHNVTPPHFFAPFDRNAEKSCQWGLDNVTEMRPHVDYCMAVSEFNRSDLLKYGYTCKISVCPILIPFEDYQKEADNHILDLYRDGKTNLLFVGRIVPNKKFEDIIAVFAEYQKRNKEARLLLVGTYDPQGAYYQYLQNYIKTHHIYNVIFTGHISFSEILAYYRVADVFLCMSEHEGFCVPLVEAMFFDVPIIAYASTAIPETLGDSGVLVHNKKPEIVVEYIQKILADHAYKNEILQKQRNRLNEFSYENVYQTLTKQISKLVGEDFEE